MEVERLQREYPVTVRWSPYLLDPTIPPEGRTRTPNTSPSEPQTHLEERAESNGLKLPRGNVFTPSSHLALQATEFAYEHYGETEGMHRSLFKAYFEDFENIGRQDILVRLASENGIDGEALGRALDSGLYRDRVEKQIEWARNLGVTSVPTFIFNDQYAIVGAQEYEVFQMVLDKLGYPPRSTSSN